MSEAAPLNRRLLLSAGWALLARPASAQAPLSPPPLVYYGGAAGRLTMARDDLGGNPFASAFVDVLASDTLTLSRFGVQLAAATWRRSNGAQSADVPRKVADPGWRFAPDPGERRLALVLANADYSRSGVPSLPGALFDAARVGDALQRAGFATQRMIDVSRAQALAGLAAFEAESRSADVALVYIAGHGVQHRRQVYWLMGDYPDPERSSGLATHAVALAEIGDAMKARRLNFIFYSSCRDDPFSAG
jgi:hypothetical protein